MSIKKLEDTERGFKQLFTPELAESAYADLVAASLSIKRPKNIWETFDFLGDHLRLSGIELQRPLHLAPYIDALQRIRDGEVQKFCFHAPPRHSKSLSSMVALLFYSLDWPNKKHLYITYNIDRADKVRLEFEKNYLKATNTLYKRNGDSLVMENGSSIQFTSWQGSITGETYDGVILVDDVIKSDNSAAKSTEKEKIWAFFDPVLSTRDTGNLSIIVMMTRWATDDLIGRLIEEKGYPYIRLPAICDDVDDPLGREIGEALWPNSPTQMDEKYFEEKKRTVPDDVWAAMYQGTPGMTEGSLFKKEPIYTEWPQHKKDRAAVFYGLDVSDGKKDPCVLVRYLFDDNEILIDDVVIKNYSYSLFVKDIRTATIDKPGEIYMIGSPAEGATVNFINQELRNDPLVDPRVRVSFRSSNLPKSTRAAHVMKAWNGGYISLDNELKYRKMGRQFINAIQNYDGKSNKYADEVDALTCGFEPLKPYLHRLIQSNYSQKDRRKFARYRTQSPLKGLKPKRSLKIKNQTRKI